MDNNSFFPLIVLVEHRPLYLFFSAAPQRTAYSEVPFQMAAHLRIGSPPQAGKIARFKPKTAGLQSGVATNETQMLPK